MNQIRKEITQPHRVVDCQIGAKAKDLSVVNFTQAFGYLLDSWRRRSRSCKNAVRVSIMTGYERSAANCAYSDPCLLQLWSPP